MGWVAMPRWSMAGLSTAAVRWWPALCRFFYFISCTTNPRCHHGGPPPPSEKWLTQKVIQFDSRHQPPPPRPRREDKTKQAASNTAVQKQRSENMARTIIALHRPGRPSGDIINILVRLCVYVWGLTRCFLPRNVTGWILCRLILPNTLPEHTHTYTKVMTSCLSVRKYSTLTVEIFPSRFPFPYRHRPHSIDRKKRSFSFFVVFV